MRADLFQDHDSVDEIADLKLSGVLRIHMCELHSRMLSSRFVLTQAIERALHTCESCGKSSTNQMCCSISLMHVILWSV